MPRPCIASTLAGKPFTRLIRLDKDLTGMVNHMGIGENTLAGDHDTGARDIMSGTIGPGTEWVRLTVLPKILTTDLRIADRWRHLPGQANLVPPS